MNPKFADMPTADQSSISREHRWWSEDAGAVVTGANKGIGLEIARQLGRRGFHVVVTSRDPGKGQRAVKDLQKSVPSANFYYHQADISDHGSVQRCADFIKGHRIIGHVAVLVNNAGIALSKDAFSAEDAQKTIDVNLIGTRRFTDAMLPLMKPSSRVVNVCSSAGKLSQLSSSELRNKFMDPPCADAIVRLADSYVQAIADGTYKDKGWSSSMYGVSKLAEISYTLWLAKTLGPKGILVNAVCPGYVDTDMTSHQGHRSPAEGADTPVWVALQDWAMTGRFYKDREEIKW